MARIHVYRTLITPIKLQFRGETVEIKFSKANHQKREVNKRRMTIRMEIYHESSLKHA